MRVGAKEKEWSLQHQEDNFLHQHSVPHKGVVGNLLKNLRNCLEMMACYFPLGLAWLSIPGESEGGEIKGAAFIKQSLLHCITLIDLEENKLFNI